MNASAVLEELGRRGVTVEVRGGNLRLTPGSAINAEMRSVLIEHKTAILALLQGAVLAPTETLPSLVAEESLYRLWWRTLPDKALARRLDGHLAYWGRERGLSEGALAWLRGRVGDLLMDTKRKPHPKARVA